MINLKSGDKYLYSGPLYTIRDAAHARLEELFKNNKKLPIDLNGAIIYYAGPTPTKPHTAVGSIGPTTSSRMDKFSYLMKEFGVKATIGKGPRSKEAKEIYYNDGILYFVATGGIGALLSQCVLSSEVVAFDDLGAESIKKLVVSDFPLILAYDLEGNNIFWEEIK